MYSVHLDHFIQVKPSPPSSLMYSHWTSHQAMKSRSASSHKSSERIKVNWIILLAVQYLKYATVVSLWVFYSFVLLFKIKNEIFAAHWPQFSHRNQIVFYSISTPIYTIRACLLKTTICFPIYRRTFCLCSSVSLFICCLLSIVYSSVCLCLLSLSLFISHFPLPTRSCKSKSITKRSRAVIAEHLSRHHRLTFHKITFSSH